MNNQRPDLSVYELPHHFFSKHFLSRLRLLVKQMGDIIVLMEIYAVTDSHPHARIQKILLTAADEIAKVVMEKKPND